jgi:hypothetical protein
MKATKTDVAVDARMAAFGAFIEATEALAAARKAFCEAVEAEFGAPVAQKLEASGASPARGVA